MLLRQFKQYITENQLFNQNQNLLATVSGGADSTVMLDLLARCQFKVSVAHCNFKLRGADADADEEFVRCLAEKYQMPFISISFNTLDYAREHKISVEMAARELRYNWFQKLATEHNFDKILTAHHLDDNIETLFLNLARGTGINGLTGILPINGNIVRPLLFASRKQIEEYAKLNKISFRTDSTNLSDDYQRNIIRHNVVPIFQQLNPAFDERMFKNFRNITQAAQIYNWYITKAKTELLQTANTQTSINIQLLLQQPFPEPVLYECVNEYGFNSAQVLQMMKLVGQKSGSVFESDEYKLLIDRNLILITKKQIDDFQPIEIGEPCNIESVGLKMQIVAIEQFTLDKHPTVACLDFDKLQFPLTLRRWQNGDYFYPIGMNRAKKLSDFFIDIKLNVFAKKSALVLTSNAAIAWVVGLRPDNRFRIDASTKRVLIISQE